MNGMHNLMVLYVDGVVLRMALQNFPINRAALPRPLLGRVLTSYMDSSFGHSCVSTRGASGESLTPSGGDINELLRWKRQSPRCLSPESVFGLRMLSGEYSKRL